MLATKPSRFTTFAKRCLMLCLTSATASLLPASIAGAVDGPVRLRRAEPVQRTSWSPARIEADAAAMPERAPRLVQRSVGPRQSDSANTKPTRARSGDVQQVGFLEDYGACGPVCDCGECAGSIVGDPGCGIEGSYLVEPGCGMEPGGGFEPGYGFEPACGVESFGGEMCGCDACSPSHQVDCFPLFLPILRVDWNRFEFFAGNQAYHNPMNDPATGATTNADSGSFGFHQGFNEGRNLRPWIGADLSAQFGLRATQSNIHEEGFTNQNRNQIFLTGGLFRRVDYGLQYGMVLDYLNEDWYYQANLLQLRGELSWKFSACQGFGFHWMGGVSDETVATQVRNEAGTIFNGTRDLEASNQYRAFYRYSFGSSGQWTSFIGGTDNEHLILGSDMDMPLKHGFSMRVNSTYFAPGDDSVLEKHRAEGWNIGMSLVFRPGAARRSSQYSRPMFDVADNGSFFVFGQ